MSMYGTQVELEHRQASVHVDAPLHTSLPPVRVALSIPGGSVSVYMTLDETRALVAALEQRVNEQLVRVAA